ncbi:unnamed protein product [Ixodes pacificus]
MPCLRFLSTRSPDDPPSKAEPLQKGKDQSWCRMRWMLQHLGHLSKKLLLIQPWTTTASASLSKPQNQRVLTLAAKKKKTQTSTQGRSIGIQTEPSIRHLGCQTDSTWSTERPPLQVSPPLLTDDEQHELSDEDDVDKADTAVIWDSDM